MKKCQPYQSGSAVQLDQLIETIVHFRQASPGLAQILDKLSEVRALFSREQESLASPFRLQGKGASETIHVDLVSHLVETVSSAFEAWRRAYWNCTPLECEVGELASAIAHLSWLHKQLSDSSSSRVQ